MHFYALRIVCWNCGATSLLGGSPEHDLTRWRQSTVECHACGAETSAADATAVHLGGLPRHTEVVENLAKILPINTAITMTSSAVLIVLLVWQRDAVPPSIPVASAIA